MTPKDKLSTFAHSAVTWAVGISTVITLVMAEIQNADWFPSDWAGAVVKYGTIALGVIASAVRVLKQVTPVPEEGMQVLLDDGDTLDVHRGWDPPEVP